VFAVEQRDALLDHVLALADKDSQADTLLISSFWL